MSSVELPWILVPTEHPGAGDPTRLVVGTRVGSWRVLARHQAGTFGVVYLAVRAGEETAGPCALKLSRQRKDARLEREAQLLARVEHPNVPKLHGYGEWQGFAYVVMDWVAGVELYQWARLCNPPRRQVARLLSKLAWALSAVHEVGGVHRDIKGDNVLVHLDSAEPVLTDFGAGTWAGAAPLTVLGPPGTPLYFSPERLRAHLNLLPPGASSGAGPADDVYGLGVTAYRLLTDTYPFTELDEAQRTQERLRGRLPRAPHEVNPAVPPELSALVLRMLAARPEERPYANEVDRTMERLRQSPEQTWEGLLFAWEPEPSRLGPGNRHRGQVADELRRAVARAEESLSRVAAEVERVHAEQRAPTTRDAPEPPPVPRHSPLERLRARPWRQVAWVALALVAVGAGALGLAWVLRPGNVPGLPTSSPRSPPTQEVGKEGQELALPRKLPESETGAAPIEARTPAPAANATLPKDMPAVKKQTQKAAPPPPEEKKGLDAAKRAVGAALCTGLACASPAPVPDGPTIFPLRHEPPPQECPRGAVEAMAEHGIQVGQQKRAIFAGYENLELISRREGPVLILNDLRWGDLPASVVFAGQLFFGTERVYIRLTEARMEDGRRFPVCLDVYELGGKRGSTVQPGSTRDEVKMSNIVELRAVDRFK